MNLNDKPTIEQFRDLLRAHDDRAGHHVLWVRKDGEVMLTCLPRSNPRRPPTYEHPDMQVRYDTFPVGYEYVGAEAAEDKWWAAKLFGNMLEQWSKARGTAGVLHIRLHTVAPEGKQVDEGELAEIRCEREELARRKQTGQSGCCPVPGQ